ncbi:MAG: 7-carboxy-7-deazaguanine synthase [Saccharospirillaceae bacterium]|nr:7-carboxy-7-deazaguanine synthase [Pseudomonadales bacterium]NRB81874.1 7-carboxy-7-deazaguanine synthase [Saccharospirillaceae bacterium]
MYIIKEAFYSLQGEGAQTGRPSIFCRFASCNLWNGKESSRANSICTFCDTDILGSDGINGGKFKSETALVDNILSLWPCNETPAYIIFTGGEPALQLTQTLIDEFKSRNTILAIETNGTLELPSGIDWICVSPKGASNVIISKCDELKLVYPQNDALPEKFSHIKAKKYYLSPKNPLNNDDIISSQNDALTQCMDYCLAHPKWSLSLQTHKILNIA